MPSPVDAVRQAEKPFGRLVNAVEMALGYQEGFFVARRVEGMRVVVFPRCAGREGYGQGAETQAEVVDATEGDAHRVGEVFLEVDASYYFALGDLEEV